jgi:glycosyltransferase involved in cell wall biosynthesis
MRKCTQIDKVRSTIKSFSQIDKVRTYKKARSATKNFSLIDKPLVSILLAVYKPNEAWFIEQLISLNEQTYDNIQLLIYDDCPDYPVDEEVISQYIIKFSYTLIRGIQNKGSNKAFEELTNAANGELLAYCDQDDIWEANKINLMVDGFVDEDVTLVCSDLSIINEKGIKTADSITDIKKRIVYKSGYNLAKDLLITNFVTGCAMMVKKDIAQRAIPFEKTLIHDQWISIIAAINGKIEFINKPLVRYRQHSFNQTSILKDVYDKKTYYNKRIEEFICRYRYLQKRLECEDLKEYLNYCLIWTGARKSYFQKPNIKDLNVMIKYKDFHKFSIIIESVLPFIPEMVFRYVIKLAKKGVL